MKTIPFRLLYGILISTYDMIEKEFEVGKKKKKRESPLKTLVEPARLGLCWALRAWLGTDVGVPGPTRGLNVGGNSSTSRWEPDFVSTGRLDFLHLGLLSPSSQFEAVQSSRQEVIWKLPSRGGGLASWRGRRAGLEESFFGDG